MSQSRRLNFIVIDDSKLDCFIAERIIKNTGKGESIRSFLQATEAIDFIAAAPPAAADSHTIILVDIQMPIMNGFEFVAAFEQLKGIVRSDYTIYVISSSINENDIQKMKQFVTVKEFLNKPLTTSTLAGILE